MKKWHIPGMFLSLLVITVAQAALGQEGAPGPLPFNPQTIETVQGIVVEAAEVKPGGIPEMEHLTLKVKEEKLTVVLGPSWFLSQQNWKVTTLEHLEVTGSRLNLNGKPTLVAQEVKKGGQFIKFRDKSGRPLWAHRHPQAK